MKIIAFDCFGTVFDMDGVSRDEIVEYVTHVKRNDFTPYEFPRSWWELKLHPDSAEGVSMLQSAGYRCVTLSNGSADLLQHVSEQGGILWDCIIDLVKYRVYKPHNDAYLTVRSETGVDPEDCMMVTANPGFGDVEGAGAIGMAAQVIRHPGQPKTIIELANAVIGRYGWHDLESGA